MPGLKSDAVRQVPRYNKKGTGQTDHRPRPWQGPYRYFSHFATILSSCFHPDCCINIIRLCIFMVVLDWVSFPDLISQNVMLPGHFNRVVFLPVPCK